MQERPLLGQKLQGGYMFKGIKLLKDNKIDSVSARVKITKDQVFVETDIGATDDSVAEVDRDEVNTDEISV